MTKVLSIIGVGAGVSMAVAKHFGQQGYSVALISRNLEKLQGFVQTLAAEGIQALAFQADTYDSKSIQAALAQAEQALGATQVLLYNAAALRARNILLETPEQLEQDFKVNVSNALAAVKAVKDKMQAGEASILLTGGGFAMQPNPNYGSLSIGKAALRNLAFSLSQALQSKQIYVGTVTIAGYVKPDTDHAPERVAEEFWELHQTRQAVEFVL